MVGMKTNNKVSGVIYGVLPSMKNSRQIGLMKRKKFSFGKKPYHPIIMKSAAARNYVESAIPQIDFRQRVGFVVDVALTVYVFYPDRRHDVDCELLCDILQKANVVKNDRQIRVKHFDGSELDKNNPRVEWEIEPL